MLLHCCDHYRTRQVSPQRSPLPELVMPQVDFAPSMAALLGLPIPFGSIGKLSQELWDVAHSLGGHASKDAFAKALLGNAKQVHT